MTHDDCLVVRSERSDQVRRVPCRGRRSAEGLADIDDLMRQLSDLLTYPALCRIRACRRAQRCRGGAGPPCLNEAPRVFAAAMSDRMRGIRRFWARQRRLAAERQAAEKPATRENEAPTSSPAPP
jgi:hypothetical protein